MPGNQSYYVLALTPCHLQVILQSLLYFSVMIPRHSQVIFTMVYFYSFYYIFVEYMVLVLTHFSLLVLLIYGNIVFS